MKLLGCEAWSAHSKVQQDFGSKRLLTQFNCQCQTRILRCFMFHREMCAS